MITQQQKSQLSWFSTSLCDHQCYLHLTAAAELWYTPRPSKLCSKHNIYGMMRSGRTLLPFDQSTFVIRVTAGFIVWRSS